MRKLITSQNLSTLDQILRSELEAEGSFRSSSKWYGKVTHSSSIIFSSFRFPRLGLICSLCNQRENSCILRIDYLVCRENNKNIQFGGLSRYVK